MASFARLDENNVVIEVHSVNNDVILDDDGNESEAIGIAFQQSLFGADTVWKQTSYNGNMRKNFAGIGYTYDADRDAFIPPKPFDSWVLNETICQWEAPIPRPDYDNRYRWDEDAYQTDNTEGWVQI